MITNRKRDIIPINKPLKFSLPIYYIDSHYNPYAIFRINGLMDCCEDIFHINHRTPHTTFNIKHDLHAVSYSASRPTNSTSSSAMFMPAISHRQLIWWDQGLATSPGYQAQPTRFGLKPARPSHTSSSSAVLDSILQRFGFSVTLPWRTIALVSPHFLTLSHFGLWRLTSFIMVLGTPYDCRGTWAIVNILYADALLAPSCMNPQQPLNPNGRSWCGRLDLNQQIG